MNKEVSQKYNFTYVNYKNKQNQILLFRDAYLVTKINKNKEVITIRKGQCYNWKDREAEDTDWDGA